MMTSYSIKILILIVVLSIPTIAIPAADGPRLSLEDAAEYVSNNLETVLSPMLRKDFRAWGGYCLASACRVPEHPEFIAKDQGDARDANGKMMRKCIEDLELNLLVVPETRICPIDRTKILDPRLKKIYLPQALCIAEYLDGSINGTITKEQAVQLYTLIINAKKTPGDWKLGNIIYMPDGRLGLCDMDERTFSDGIKASLENIFLSRQALTDEAREYLLECIRRL